VVRDASYACAGDRADLSFTLAKGQYATVLLREVKPDDPVVGGLARSATTLIHSSQIQSRSVCPRMSTT
jgi:hypothetical protein